MKYVPILVWVFLVLALAYVLGLILKAQVEGLPL